MFFSSLQAMTTWLSIPAHWNGSMALLLSKIPFDWIVLGQQVSDPDLWGQVQRAWGHFVQTGQIWAFLFGVILGYGIKAFTSFG